ncbi:MAG: hypothetical protein DMG32_09335 [Acidobacteria bacterium]|nr:MAG: hypothetical protein DMG32_09335 [Acidobacteriota bacterium]
MRADAGQPRRGNNGRFVASRPREKAKTLASGRFRVADEVDYFRMADFSGLSLSSLLILICPLMSGALAQYALYVL